MLCQSTVLSLVSARACRCHGIEHSFQPGKGENTFYAFSTDPAGLQTPAYNFKDAVDSWWAPQHDFGHKSQDGAIRPWSISISYMTEAVPLC
jgi:hypothetical protein